MIGAGAVEDNLEHSQITLGNTPVELGQTISNILV